MRVCLNQLPSRRILAVLLALIGTAGWLRADSIVFTRPAVPIVAPEKGEDSLPRPRGQQVDFSEPIRPAPVMAPQVIQRQPSRSQDRDDEEKVHWLLRDPKKLPGIFGKDPLKPAPTFAEKDPRRLPWQNSENAKGEDTRSLSPITSFDWNDRDPREREKNPLTDKRSGQRQDEREDERAISSFSLRPEKKEEQSGAFRWSGADSLASEIRDKPTAAELESRAAFQELLNPRQGPEIQRAGSLEPITAFNEPKSAAPVPARSTTPALNESLFVRGPIDPTESFQEKQARFTSPNFYDPGKKYLPPQPKADTSRKVDPVFQKPLLQQPLQHEVPKRKF